MPVKTLRRTPNRRWHELIVEGREQIVGYGDVKVTVLTGITDVDGNDVVSVEVMSKPTTKFELEHSIPQAAKIFARVPKH